MQLKKKKISWTFPFRFGIIIRNMEVFYWARNVNVLPQKGVYYGEETNERKRCNYFVRPSWLSNLAFGKSIVGTDDMEGYGTAKYAGSI